MPRENYTSPGSYTWTAPFACRFVTATVIGGGGSGYKDCDGDDEGGGGGGGGFARGTKLVPQGTVLSIEVGAGGSRVSCNSRSGGNGGRSRVTGGILSVRATGGECGYDDSGGGSAGGADSGDITNSGQRGDDDDQGGEGGGAGNASGNSGRGSGSRPGGRGTSLGGGVGGSNSGRDGGNWGGGGGGNDDGSGGKGANGAARIQWDYYSPSITTFSVSNQFSTAGTPRDDVLFTVVTSYADNVSISGGVGAVGATGSFGHNTGLVSNASGGPSPATKTYTLTASGPGGTVTATTTTQVKNDNTPSNTWNTTFTNLEPNTLVDLTLGTITGVDMPTTISTSGTGNFIGAFGSFSGTKNFNNGNVVQLRTTTLPFNTDVSGSTGIYGKVNNKTVTIVTPAGSFGVTVGTRAPRIREDFDINDNINKYPFADIDVIPNTPVEYVTSAQVDVDDIEIDMEIKTNKADAQVSINGGSWQNVRSM